MRERRASAMVALLALAVLGAAGPVAGAGTTAVALDPADAAVEPGATATLDVVVTDAEGGVGAYNLTVAGADGVAAVEAVSVPGDPAMRERTVEDGDATVRVVGLDTEQSGRVTVATVRVRAAETNGTGTLSLRVAALGDEDGNSYDVRAVEGATVTVGNTGGGGDGSDDSGSAGGSGDAGGTGGADDAVGPGSTGESGADSTTTETTTATDTSTVATTTATEPTTTTAGAVTATETTATGTPTGTTAAASPGATSGGSPGVGVLGALAALLAAVLGRAAT
ncbi:hypothetical protein EFA46_013030 (plasmid) [Halarchaeum sp. CBA1220]|uniref:hypothetical protein n=1 Tax=Halarchaeum sp. CBA1220 TaxID=1853682 RepID=UPI000F3A9B88|nr:hypothetical protein [Halarchaeum sp. CBA1220]QLC35169.1 hypothetical protein EFA46_013030 [Halarchaeum sp. CBA1220]